MKRKEVYALSRSRDRQGNVVKRNLNPYVNCLHTQMGGGRLNMAVLVMEIMKTNHNESPLVGNSYRIRKLTPRECFRLMGVDDADIDKLMSAGISNSQLYKCAGNSIVVDTLYHLFRKLFCDKESEEAAYQQTLF